MRSHEYIFQARSFLAWLGPAGRAGDFPQATCGMTISLLCAVLTMVRLYVSQHDKDGNAAWAM